MIFDAIGDDLNKPENIPNRRFLRYFTLTHLANANRPEEELQTYRNGLTKLVNSLSWGRRVVPLVPVDRAKTVFRIDLRDLQWSNTVWNTLVAAHPYNLEPFVEREKRIRTVTGTRVVHLRGDWFVAQASRPPLYHQVLQIPDNVAALEARLGVDVARNIENKRIARGGFNGSGVSKNNRLIERHESSFGSYWKSYDFAGNTGKQNLFDRPLGPGDTDRLFDHDGGEIIFNLPNGLQAYMLVDANGKRIDKGPTAIVSDPSRPDRAVENGISCMGCHARGMIRKDDQIRGHVQQNVKAFAAGEANFILTVYPGTAVLNTLLDEDQERFRKAVELCNVPLTKTEPILTTVKRYEDELDLPLVLGESLTDEATFRTILAASAELTRTLGSVLVKGGTIQRDTFERSFPALQLALLRKQYAPSQTRKPTIANPSGIDDGAQLFSPATLTFAGKVIDEAKATFKLDLAIVTLANIPDADFPVFARRKQADQFAITSKLLTNRMRETKHKGLMLLVTQELGNHIRTVNFQGTTAIKRDDTNRLMEAIKDDFNKNDFDAGLRAFLPVAVEILEKEASAPKPKK